MEFIPCDIDLLPFEALKFLQSAIDRTPAQDSTLWEVLRGGGEVFLMIDGGVIGATYVEFHPEVMNIVLLAGDVGKYRDEVYHFYIDLIKSRGVKNIFICGRAGWGKLFPELRTIGTLFSLTLGGVCGEAS